MVQIKDGQKRSADDITSADIPSGQRPPGYSTDLAQNFH